MEILEPHRMRTRYQWVDVSLISKVIRVRVCVNTQSKITLDHIRGILSILVCIRALVKVA